MIDRAKDIFRAAETYSKSAGYLNSFINQDHDQFLPSQVIAALALELYFKALYYIEFCKDFKVNGRHSHDIHELFNGLSEKSKDMLTRSFKSQIMGQDMRDVEAIESESNVNIPRDLSGNLRCWSEIFTKVRYMHDRASEERVMMFFPEIEKSVRSVVFAYRPDLKS